MSQANQRHDKQASIQEMLVKLKASFRDQILDRMLVIENASVRLSAAEDDSFAIASIKRECHKLSGVSKTLGFSELGDLATEIDCAIAHGAAPWSALKPKVEKLLDRMEAELDGQP